MKLTSETEMVHVNGKKVGGSDAVTKFTAYVSPYVVVSNVRSIRKKEPDLLGRYKNIRVYGSW